MSSKMWDEITYPFPNVNGCTVWEWISNFYPTLYNGCNHLSMLRPMLVTGSLLRSVGAADTSSIQRRLDMKRDIEGHIYLIKNYDWR